MHIEEQIAANLKIIQTIPEKKDREAELNRLTKLEKRGRRARSRDKTRKKGSKEIVF